MKTYRFLLALVFSLGLVADVVRAASPETANADSHFDFGKVAQGKILEHQFPLRNDSDQPLRIAGVQLTPPLQLAKMPAVIPAHGTGMLKLTLDTRKVEGDYSGQLVVILDGQAGVPRLFSFTGKVVPGIEILPLPAFFLSTPKGVAKSASVEIVSHEDEPLTLAIKSPPAPNYTAKLTPLEKGKRFRLTVTIPASAAPGRTSGRIELSSSSATTPVVYVGMNTIVRERVYTFPDAVDFGQVAASSLQDGTTTVPGASQTLMVYQTGGKKFSVEASSDIPGLEVSVEPGPAGDRVQLTASLRKGKVAKGSIRGTLTLKTNDAEFRELKVPVTGTITAD